MQTDLEQLTLSIIKPDGVEQHLEEAIRERLLKRGFHFLREDNRVLTTDEVRAHYAAHNDQPWFEDVVAHMTSGKSWLFVLRRPNAARVLKTMIGATDPDNAAPGTIRGDYGRPMTRGDNIIHGSDPSENNAIALEEIERFFPKLINTLTGP